MNNIHSIPDLYILPRWTKCAKERAIFSSLEPSNDQTSTRALRASELNHIGHIIFNKASLTPRGTQIVKDKLKEALILVENELECNLGGSTTNYSNEGVEVYDPPHIRLKGLTNARIRCQFENKKKRKKMLHKPHMFH